MNYEENNSFTGDIPIACQKGTNTINVAGNDYCGEFKISQNKNMLFEYSNNIFSDNFPFGKDSPLDKDLPFK